MIKKMGLICLLACVTVLQGMNDCDRGCCECGGGPVFSVVEKSQKNNATQDNKRLVKAEAFLGLVTLDGSSIAEMKPAIQAVITEKKKATVEASFGSGLKKGFYNK
jgi:hypothetical protein